MGDNHLNFELDGELAMYDRWAKQLAWKYNRPNAFVTWDDIYQIAMLSYLETVASTPGRHSGYYMTRMRWDVLKEIRHFEVRGKHECTFDQTLQFLAIDDVERTVVSDKVEDIIGQCLTQMSDAEFMAITLKMMGYNVLTVAKEAGWNKVKARKALSQGRKRLREWLTALEVIA